MKILREIEVEALKRNEAERIAEQVKWPIADLP